MQEQELSVKDASKYSDLSISYLIRLLHTGKIRGRRFGPMWLIDRASLDAYSSQKHKPGPKGRKFQHMPEQEDALTEVAA